MEWLVEPAVQGGVATTYRIKLATSVLAGRTTTSLNGLYFRVFLFNSGATNVQRVLALIFDLVTLTLVAGSSAPFTVDTTVDQTLAFTIQPGAATDSLNARFAHVHSFTGSVSGI